MSLLDPSETFASLAETVGLDNRLKKAISRLGHVRPTLVQSKCLPLAIASGRDLLVRARTGSGKTLAYCLPLLQKILSQTSSANGVRGVILVPTRELCTQVHSTLVELTYYCDEVVSLAILTGGRAKSEKGRQEIARQEAMLRDKPDVVVATPGGLLTHIRNNVLHLKESVETLVVDEADLVLSFGYTNDITEIMRSLPKICQGFLMSATLSPELNSLKNVVLHSPAILKLEEDKEEAKARKGRLVQFFLALPKKDKNLVIYVFLKLGLLKGKGLFFVNTTDGGYALKLFLEHFHVRTAVLNAELPLRSRLNIIEQFNVGNFDYLIATDESADVGPASKEEVDDEDDEENEPTDEADDDKSNGARTKKRNRKDSEYGVARGLDFRNVSFVVNVDFPPSPKSYTHRVGRTARGGARGVALSLVEIESADQAELLHQVQEDQPKLAAHAAVNGGPLQGSLDDDGTAQEDRVQPSPLEFDLTEIEGFRYRVEDMSRAVTRNAIREARASELKAEILNSERLQNHFDKNPGDLQLLRHDRMSNQRVHEHLRNVPKYMLPRGMQVAKLNKKRRRRRKTYRMDGQRRTDNDPLQSFEAGDDAVLDGDTGAEGDDADDDGFADFFEGNGENDTEKKTKSVPKESRVFSSTTEGTGRSTSGRNAWKEKHRKGKFSNKRRKTEPRRRTVGI